MSIKLIVLQGGEQVITEIKELVSNDKEKVIGYMLTKPHKVVVNRPLLVAEQDEDRSVEITLSPWILLTSDKEIAIPPHHVVALVEPLDSVLKMYLEKTDGEPNSSDKPTSSD